MSETSSPMPQADRATHVVGIDIGMESCTMCCLARNKQPLIPATPFANTLTGFNTLFERLDGLGVPPELVLIGLEATSRYGENLFQALLKRGYQVCLLHPAQMHAFAQQRGMRAKTDQLDAFTIARALRKSERHALAMCRANKSRRIASCCAFTTNESRRSRALQK